MTNNTILDLTYDAVWEPELIPSGEEVTLSVVAAGVHVSMNSGNASLKVVFKPISPGHERAPLITRFFSIPSKEELAAHSTGTGEMAERCNMKLRALKRFEEAFSISQGPHDLSDPSDNDYTGAEGTAIVDIESQEGFPDRNVIKYFMNGM